MPEISQADLDGLMQIKSLYALMLQNPNARDKLHEATKIVRPDAVTELTQAERHVAPVKEKLEKTEAQLADLQKQWLADKAERDAEKQRMQFEQQWNAQENALRRAGYMDAAIDDIKALAARKGIVDLADAAAIYDKNTPPATPVQSRFSSLTMTEGGMADTTDEYMKALFSGRGEAPGATRKQISAALGRAA